MDPLKAGRRLFSQFRIFQREYRALIGFFCFIELQIFQFFQLFSVDPVGRKGRGKACQRNHEREGVGETVLFDHSMNIFFNRPFAPFCQEKGSDILVIHPDIVDWGFHLEKRLILLFLFFTILNLSSQERSFPPVQESYTPLGISDPLMTLPRQIPFENDPEKIIRFFPPLTVSSDQAVSVRLNRVLSGPAFIVTSQGEIPLSLSSFPGGTVIHLVTEQGRVIQGIRYREKESAQGSPLAINVTDAPPNGLFLSLNRPDTLEYKLPRDMLHGTDVVILKVSSSRDLVLTGIKDAPLAVKARPVSQTLSLNAEQSRSDVWSLSPVSGLDEISFSRTPRPAFPEPLPGNLRDILDAPVESWRNGNFEIYFWNDFPHILVWDCLDYGVQNRFFRRLSYFVEKKGFRGSLLSNRELQGLHGWNAHDYRPEDLAEFFNLAEKLNFPLYREEWVMRDILLSNGILERDPEGILIPEKGAVISIARESSPVLRERFLIHEASHGLYFTSAEYREYIARIWEGLTEEDRGMWRFYLGWYGYDPSDEDLMINEFQAYLVQQRSDEASGYFDVRLKNLIRLYPEQKNLLQSGIDDKSGKFQVWSELIGHWLYEKWGIEPGDFFHLYKEI